MLLTVQNIGRILDLYAVDRPEWGPTEVASELGMGKSKAQQLLSSMAEIGLLRRVSGGRYRPGWRALQLERIVTGSAPFRPVARAMAEVLSQRSGETVHVATLDAGRVVYVDRIVGARAAPIPASSVGETLPAHCSGVGKVLLAHLDPGALDAVLDRHGLPRRTKATITDRDALYAELHRVRRDGVAYDREEVVKGLTCVAAPITDPDGVVVAAISLSAATNRYARSGDAFRAAVIQAAAGVSARLRAGAPPLVSVQDA